MIFTYSMVSTKTIVQNSEFFLSFLECEYVEKVQSVQLDRGITEMRIARETDIGYEEDCYGWDADDNVDFQPHQVDNGWDEVTMNNNNKMKK